MITFTILFIAFAVIAAVTAIALVTGGAAFIVAFGDVIICVGLIVLIVRHFVKKRGSKKKGV